METGRNEAGKVYISEPQRAIRLSHSVSTFLRAENGFSNNSRHSGNENKRNVCIREALHPIATHWTFGRRESLAIRAARWNNIPASRADSFPAGLLVCRPTRIYRTPLGNADMFTYNSIWLPLTGCLMELRSHNAIVIFPNSD